MSTPVMGMTYAVGAAWLVVALISGLYLCAVTVRRAVLLAGAVLPENAPTPTKAVEPDVLVVIPSHNEEAVIEECVRSVLSLDWPARRLRVAVVDDGSTDGTVQILDRLRRDDGRVIPIQLPNRTGKAAALNEAFRRVGFGEWLLILDADAVVDTDALRQLIAAVFNGADAAQGAMTPRNPRDTVSTFHTAVESAVHQGVTQRGAERLGLTRSLLGSNTLIRRATLAEFGGWDENTRLEDVDFTVRLHVAGRVIHYVAAARSTILATQDSTQSRQQHRAWSAAYVAIAVRQMRAILSAPIPFLRKLDLVLFAFGYLDRLAFVLYAVAWIATRVVHGVPAPTWVPAATLAVAAGQGLLAMVRLPARPVDLRFLRDLPSFLYLELGSHLAALVDAIRRRPVVRTRTVRGSDG